MYMNGIAVKVFFKTQILISFFALLPAHTYSSKSIEQLWPEEPPFLPSESRTVRTPTPRWKSLGPLDPGLVTPGRGERRVTAGARHTTLKPIATVQRERAAGAPDTTEYQLASVGAQE